MDELGAEEEVGLFVMGGGGGVADSGGVSWMKEV